MALNSLTLSFLTFPAISVSLILSLDSCHSNGSVPETLPHTCPVPTAEGTQPQTLAGAQVPSPVLSAQLCFPELMQHR